MHEAVALNIDCLSAGILVADHLCTPIAELPSAGQLVLADELPLAIGGCASNVGTDLAKVGVRVGVAGCVGSDVFGQFIVDELTASGVETSGIARLEGVGTSATLIINVQGQDRRFIHTVGANARFSASQIPLDRVRQAKVLYVGGYLLMPALEADLPELFRQAREAGVKTVLDVVLPGPGDHWARLAPVLVHTDVFLPNSDEAAAITGLSDPREQVERFREAGARSVVITCGEQGTWLVSDTERLRAGIFKLPYVGGTGSGDAFDAGYIAGMLAGHDERGCLRWGSALGASCVRAIGATEGVFDRQEAEAFLAANELTIEKW